MLKPGLYEQMINQLLHQSISGLDPNLAEKKALDAGESHDVLSEYLRQCITSALRSIDGKDKLSKQIEICNQIIKQLEGTQSDKLSQRGYRLIPEAERLLSVAEQMEAVVDASLKRSDRL